MAAINNLFVIFPYLAFIALIKPTLNSSLTLFTALLAWLLLH